MAKRVQQKGDVNVKDIAHRTVKGRQIAPSAGAVPAALQYQQPGAADQGDTSPSRQCV